MQILKYLLLLMGAALIFSGCGQKSADLNDGLLTQNDAQAFSENCKVVRLHDSVLKKTNILNIFDCVGWSSEFPEIKKYLQSLNEKDLNIILGPFDKAFFKDISSRDNFLNFIVNNYSREDIRKISKFTKNIFDEKEFARLLLKVVKNSNVSFPTAKTFNSTLKLLRGLTKNNEESRSAFKEVLTKRKSESEEFQLLYENFIDGLGENLITNQKDLLPALPLFMEDGNWLYRFVNKYSTNEVSNLLTYINSDPNLYGQVSFIEDAMKNKKYNCSQFNGVYQIDYNVELRDRLYSLANFGAENFMLDLFELSERFSLFNNICPYDEFNRVSAKVLYHLRSYVLSPGGYEFLNALAKVSGKVKNDYLIFNVLKSDLFKSVSHIFENDGKNENQMLAALHELFKTFEPSTYKDLSDAISGLVSDPFYLNSNYDQILSEDDRSFVINFIIDKVLLEKDSSQNINVLSKIIKKYPALYTKVSTNLVQNAQATQNFIEHFVKNLENKDLVSELQSFWSEDNFFRLVFMLLSLEETTKNDDVIELEEINTKYEYVSILDSNEKLFDCLATFHQLAGKDYDFWFLLDSYPQSCMEIIQDKALASYIFQWTVQIDDVFYENYNTRFSERYGMIAPEMMNFYHQLMHVINTQLVKEDDYVKKVVYSIREELFEKGLVQVLESSVKVLSMADKYSDIITKSVIDISNTDPEKFDVNFKTVLSLFTLDDEPVLFPVYSCEEVSARTGAIACPEKDQVVEFYLQLKDYLLRDTGAKKKLYESFVDFLSPSIGIRIPFEARRQRTKALNLDEIVRFVFDLSGKETQKEVAFRTESEEFNVLADNSQRLEVVIRDISFLNNFYGAYFMNNVCRAKNYYNKVKSLQKNVALMDKTSNFFRNRGIFPKETKWAFKNIRETYSSLMELDYNHTQYDGSRRRYGDLIQAILTMVVETSSPVSQKYSPFQTPKPDMVNLHNGMFITTLTKYGVLSHLGKWVRTISNNDIKNIVENKKFMIVNENFLKLLNPNELKSILHTGLGHENSDQLFEDVLGELNKLNTEDYNRFLSSTFNLIYIVSNLKIDVDLSKFEQLIKVFLNNYSNLNLNSDAKLSGVIRLLDEVLESVSQLPPEKQKEIFDILSSVSDYINPDELDAMLKDKNLVKSVKNLIEDFSKYLLGTRYSSGFLKKFINDKDLTFAYLQSMIHDVAIENDNTKYFKNIFQTLSMENEGKSNLVYSLEELFIRTDKQIIEFLTDMFDKFKRQDKALNP